MLLGIQGRLDGEIDEERKQSALFCVHGEADSFICLAFNDGVEHLSAPSLCKKGVK